MIIDFLTKSCFSTSMFSSKSQLQKRTPENGTDRRDFLSLLVDEYVNSSTSDAKYQVLANLANFSYDPINFSYIREVGVLDIFLFVLKNDTCEKLLHFASAGVCNLCVDTINAEYIISNGGLQSIINLLKSKDSEILADIITTLIYLLNSQTVLEINSPDVVQIMHELESSDKRQLQNLAAIFLQDVCQMKK